MCWQCLKPNHFSSLDAALADPSDDIRYVSTYHALLAYKEGYESRRWNNELPTGTPVIVTYSFTETADLPDPEDSYYDIDGYRSFSDQQRADFRKAAAVLQETAGIILVEKTGEAMVNVMNTDGAPWGGLGFYPGASSIYTGTGKLLINSSVGLDYEPGTTAFRVILHELGHSMGLKHPFEGAIRLMKEWDVKSQTLMSYTSDAFGQQVYSPLDVEALQHLYGAPIDTSGWSWRYRQDVFVLKGGGLGDTLLAVKGQNDLDGRGGADLVVGREAADTLRGGSGDDRLFGRGGADVLAGGSGNDTLFGHMTGNAPYDAGSDILHGGDGDDLLRGGGGSDTLHGDAGNDVLVDDDAIYFSRDRLFGGTGHDTLRSHGGGDTLLGGAGDDRIEVLSGIAEARGGAGADRFDIRALANVTLRGGGGDDTFHLGGSRHALLIHTRQDQGVDRIFGFDLATDRIEISGPDAYNFLSYGGGKLRIIAGDADLRFADVSFADRGDLLIYS